MAINVSNTRRAALALASGAALLLGAVACSDAKEAANDATSAAGSAANEATSAAGSAANEASSAANSAASEATSSNEAEGSEGKDKLPAEIQTLWDNEGGETGALGALKNVENNDKGTLATFDKGWVANSKEHGAVKLIGKIGETWVNGGGLDNKVGLPTAPEQGDAAQGWTQTFEHGTIKWARGENGEYTDTIDMK
ncbi:hypothetical protein GSS87_06080 [Corynebacterium sp. 4HC-13]|uniref:LGFP repeat-containing protein n=1 Tax=Corynebacterium anserum TaxID=2684406 RepID=UPI001639FBAD|nr:hypothetical protein [Corynebacterium anserum]MBC2681965.1 hypothetical protein [Corynebacterium anserum]